MFTRILVLFLLLSTTALAGPTLVEDGQARCTIVVAATTNHHQEYVGKMASQELARILKKASGAEVKVVHESALTNASGTVIHIGSTHLARENGFDPQKLQFEETIVRSIGDSLLLLGDDTPPRLGTYYAVTLFAEKYLGVRWLWPGELGEVIPKRAAIAIPNRIDLRQTPSVKVRTWRDAANNRSVLKHAFDMGWTEAEVQKHALESVEWSRHNRWQTSMGLALNGGHAYEIWLKRFGQTHPEYFALQPCGQRDLKPKDPTGVKICHTEPGVLAQIEADIEEAFRQNPNLTSFSLSPNDGGYTGHCMCDRCRAWDEPGGEPQKLYDSITHKPFDYVALSDRMLRFYNAVAERVTVKHPRLLLVGQAYCAYDPPAVRTKAHPNVVISYVGANPYFARAEGLAERANWRGWARAGTQMMYRPNWIRMGMGMPYDYAKAFAEDLRFQVRHCRLIGTDFDTQFHFWGSQGLTHYIMARLAWDVEQDVDALVADYCRTGFGKAAPAVRRYYARVEQLSREHFQHWQPGGSWLTKGPEFYDEAFFRDVNQHLAEAARLAAEDEVAVQQRVAFLKDTIEWARIETEILQRGNRYQNGDKTQHDALAEAMRRRQQFADEHKTTWAIWLPGVRWHIQRYKGVTLPLPEEDWAASR